MSCLVVVGYFQQQNGIFFEACEVDGIQLGEFCAIIPCVAVDAYFGKRSGILFYRICFTDDEGSDRDSFLIDGNGPHSQLIACLKIPFKFYRTCGREHGNRLGMQAGGAHIVFDFGFKHFFHTLLDIFAEGGKLLALSTGMSCLATVANRNAAETCGVDLTKQITWDSMLEDGKKLHAENPDYYYLNTDTKILCEYVLRPYLRQMTGESFIIDSEKKMSFTREQLVEVLTYIKDCYDGGVFEPAEDSATFKGQIHTNPKWMDGKFVFAYGPSSSINLLMDAVPEAECTVVQMPMAEDRVNDGFFADTPQYMTVNKNSEHVEEAVDFLNYFYNNAEAQETLKDVRSIPPTSTARQLCADKGLLNQTVVDAVDLAAGLNGKSDKGYTTSAEVYAIQEDMIESIAYGQSTPEEAADNAIELINDYLSGLN